MISKDGRNLSVKDATPENYACPAGEEHLFHVKIENPHFDQRTGERKSHPRIQKFGRKAFHSMLRSALNKSGYEMVILHDPDEWLKAHPAQSKMPKAPKPAIDIDALKAQLKEELKAEMAAEANEAKKSSSKGNKKKAEPEPTPEPEVPETAEPVDPMED